ncbi:hypothetical protein [Gorillibacterium sp. CAU 1737]|uniref:hypothetical protein n=1 Tax=Gorillibacterium sp. CAU 1737 TaxID=3140362 RepID=UPI003261582B
MKRKGSLIRLSLIAGMLIYAVPQLPMGRGFTSASVFAVCWLAFALILIAAHLYDVMGVKEEKREELRRIERMKRWQREERLKGSRRTLVARKS